MDEIAIGPGCYPGNAFKVPVEMTLIGKPHRIGCIGQVKSLSDQLLRTANTDLGEVLVGSETRLSLEDTDKVEGTEPRLRCQFGKRNVRRMEILQHLF